MNYLDTLDGSIFSRLTGSGSCIFTVLEKGRSRKSLFKFKMDFPIYGQSLLKIIM